MRHTYKLYKVMKSIGGNSGYVGYSMSKRALRARNEGAYPKTDFKKEYSVAASHFGYLLEAGIIYVSEWHHTSKFGNKIPVYELYEEEGRTMVRRNKYPRFIGEVTMSILSDIDNIRWLDDAPSVADAAHAMRKASEFLKKKSRNYD